MQNFEDNQRLKSEVREAYLFNDLFSEEAQDFVPSPAVSKKPTFAVLPHWMSITRLICLLIGGLGFVFTFINIDFLIHQIPNPLIVNLTLLLTLGGFLSYILYPYLLTYYVANGLNQSPVLKYLNGLMLGFSLVLLVSLLSLPITGLGLSLIILPAPITFALSSRKYLQLDSTPRPEGSRLAFTSLFDQDLRRLAYLSLMVAFTILLGFLLLGF